VDDEVSASQNDRDTNQKRYKKNWHNQSPFVVRAEYLTHSTENGCPENDIFISGSRWNHRRRTAARPKSEERPPSSPVVPRRGGWRGAQTWLTKTTRISTAAAIRWRTTPAIPGGWWEALPHWRSSWVFFSCLGAMTGRPLQPTIQTARQ